MRRVRSEWSAWLRRIAVAIVGWLACAPSSAQASCGEYLQHRVAHAVLAIPNDSEAATPHSPADCPCRSAECRGSDRPLSPGSPAGVPMPPAGDAFWSLSRLPSFATSRGRVWPLPDRLPAGHSQPPLDPPPRVPHRA